jgi:hypothetical protein
VAASEAIAGIETAAESPSELISCVKGWLARKDSNLGSPDPEDSQRFCRWTVRSERGADSDSVDPGGNRVELAGRSQVNVIRSSNSGIDRIAFDGHWEGDWFLQFLLLRRADLRLSRVLAAATQRFGRLLARPPQGAAF